MINLNLKTQSSLVLGDKPLLDLSWHPGRGFLLLRGKEMEIPKGYCQCGCGGKTNKVKWSEIKEGYKKGDYRRFVFGHYFRLKGTQSVSWKGGIEKGKNGRIRIYQPDYENGGKKRTFRYRLKVEKLLGKPLPEKAIVHHVNGVRDDNRIENLELRTWSNHVTGYKEGFKRMR